MRALELIGYRIFGMLSFDPALPERRKALTRDGGWKIIQCCDIFLLHNRRFAIYSFYQQGVTQMQTYINKNFTTRNYDCTNVVMQVTDKAPINFNGTADDGRWVLVDALEVSQTEALCGASYPMTKGLSPIGSIAGRNFYGHL
jgi:hypothetical protein